MKGKLKKVCGGILFFAVAVVACKKDPAIPDFPTASSDISFQVSAGWPSPYYSFSGNALTQAGFDLGRKLFYDMRLSSDSSVSCGSCHQAFAAFAHSGHDVSHGVEGRLGVRNSPPLFNLNWNTSFMWDGGVNHIEVQPLAPITNVVEMNENMAHVLSKLRADDAYGPMFTKAFGSAEISTERVFKAMAQFMGALVSADSKYDKVQRGAASFTAAENSGMSVFAQKCATCHPAPLFTDHSFRNAGLKPSALNDSGRAHITLAAADLYKFKVPSLRNLSYTAPYGHDGRFATLDQVFDQMERNIFQSPSLDPAMSNGIALSAQERSDLKAFLKTLDDETFVKDKRFQEL